MAPVGLSASGTKPSAEELALRELKDGLAGALTRASELFAALDADGNGTLEKAEFRHAVDVLGLGATDATCGHTARAHAYAT